MYSVAAGAVPGSAFGNLIDPVRVDNALAYISPSFGGFTVTGAFSNNASGDDSISNNAQNNTVYAVLGQYTAGGLTVGANYHFIAAGTNAAVINDIQNFTAGCRLSLRMGLKLSGAYSWNETDFNNPTISLLLRTSRSTTSCWAPRCRSASSLPKASYIYSDGNSGGGDAQQLALGLDYNLSKRTNFYTAYSWIDNSTTAFERRG